MNSMTQVTLAAVSYSVYVFVFFMSGLDGIFCQFEELGGLVALQVQAVLHLRESRPRQIFSTPPVIGRLMASEGITTAHREYSKA